MSCHVIKMEFGHFIQWNGVLNGMCRNTPIARLQRVASAYLAWFMRRQKVARGSRRPKRERCHASSRRLPRHQQTDAPGAGCNNRRTSAFRHRQPPATTLDQRRLGRGRPGQVSFRHRTAPTTSTTTTTILDSRRDRLPPPVNIVTLHDPPPRLPSSTEPVESPLTNSRGPSATKTRRLPANARLDHQVFLHIRLLFLFHSSRDRLSYAAAPAPTQTVAFVGTQNPANRFTCDSRPTARPRDKHHHGGAPFIAAERINECRRCPVVVQVTIRAARARARRVSRVVARAGAGAGEGHRPGREARARPPGEGRVPRIRGRGMEGTSHRRVRPRSTRP